MPLPKESAMTKPRPRVCVVGSCNLDLTFRTARLPKPGETLAGKAVQIAFGGKGANQAVMAARLGAAVSLVGCVGADLFGEHVVANLRKEGIDVLHVRRHGTEPTGVAAIVVDDAARNSILVVPGANGALTPDDARAAASAIQSADVLLCQLEVPATTTEEALRIAKAGGVRTVLNPAPAAALPGDVLALADYCVPNETEAEMMTGLPTTTDAAAKKAALALQKRGACIVLLTRGEHGVLIADARGTQLVRAVKVDAVDPTGSGDAFIGAFAVFLVEGLEPVEAVRRANAVAALTVTRPGAQPSFPTRAEAETFLARPGV
jgi:ribokinase